MVLLREAEVGSPFAMNQDFIDLDLVFLTRTTQSAIHYFTRIDTPTCGAWDFVNWIMRGECIFAILVDQEPGMNRKSMPGTSERELLSELSRTKVDKIESSWPSILKSVFDPKHDGYLGQAYICPPTILIPAIFRTLLLPPSHPTR